MAVRKIVALVLCVFLSGCATTYGPSSQSLTGGFDEQELEPGIWRVYFGGNGYTTGETVQTYWLYRCAELTLEQEFDGFEILSGIQLIDLQRRKPIRFASGGMVYIPMYYETAPKPHLEADIKLLHAPFEEVPKKVFDAAALLEELDSIVTGDKCDSGNVCPHVHRYLLEDGK